MTEEECSILYRRLITLLRELDLSWVEEIAKQEITFGKLVEREEEYRPLLSRERSEEETSIRSYKNKQSRLMTIPYSEAEKLKILLNFIKQAVADTTLLEAKVIDYFSDSEVFPQDLSSIFFTDGDNENPLNHDLNRSNIAERQSSALVLKSLIDEALQNIDNGT